MLPEHASALVASDYVRTLRSANDLLSAVAGVAPNRSLDCEHRQSLAKFPPLRPGEFLSYGARPSGRPTTLMPRCLTMSDLALLTVS